jgi:hypothetical protein
MVAPAVAIAAWSDTSLSSERPTAKGGIMRALIVYESMYGNTHAVADAIAAGLRPDFDVTAVPVREATALDVATADLIVCGGPTHVHTMSSRRTRDAAVQAALKAGAVLTLEPAAEVTGLRQWFQDVSSPSNTPAAAFDTRVDAPGFVTGRASRPIARRLRAKGFHVVVPPESFLVDKTTQLVAGELERATAWGRSLATAVRAAAPAASTP